MNHKRHNIYQSISILTWHPEEKFSRSHKFVSCIDRRKARSRGSRKLPLSKAYSARRPSRRLMPWGQRALPKERPCWRSAQWDAPKSIYALGSKQTHWWYAKRRAYDTSAGEEQIPVNAQGRAPNATRHVNGGAPLGARCTCANSWSPRDRSIHKK